MKQLDELLNLLEEVGETLPVELIRVDELTPFAVERRYDYFTVPASFDRVGARSLIACVRSFVEHQIKPANPNLGSTPQP
jgi:hypothetical protein